MPFDTWQGTEREVCKHLGMDHLGGPGRPDCSDGAYVVEVKDHTRRIGVATVRSILEKEWAQDLPVIIVSASGFTEPALQLAEEYEDVLLFHWTEEDDEDDEDDDDWDDDDDE